LRRENPTLRRGDISILGWSDEVLKVRISDDAATFDVILNFGDIAQSIDFTGCVVRSDAGEMLQPSEAVLLRNA
jgi:hypothetical protein